MLATLFRSFITSGELTLIDASGNRSSFGARDAATPQDERPVVVRLHRPWLDWKLALNPNLYTGEAYMDGTLTLDEGTIYDLIAIVTRNAGIASIGYMKNVRDGVSYLLRHFQQANPISRSRQNVAHHYDLSNAFYRLFLDPDMQYSCAYYPEPGMTLEQAQEAKKRHIAAKLLLHPGQRVLDIGSGWGGLGLHLAETDGIDVTGVTLSTEQLALANQRAADSGKSAQVRFLMRDYRMETGKYDRIVSVGMFEHVGVPQYRTFFNKVRELLTDDGVALLHTIGRLDGPGVTNPWIRKYIFPGGYSPALSEVVPLIEQAGLFMTDVEVLRLHYAKTLRHWRQRFLAKWDEARSMFDERFCRMWEFYLAGSECAFRYQGHAVFQIQLAKRVDAVPLSRDYIGDYERHMAGDAPAAARSRNSRAAE
jgi:cyclopropane-fatty-acyl-phospholipid synthase